MKSKNNKSFEYPPGKNDLRHFTKFSTWSTYLLGKLDDLLKKYPGNI